MGSSAALTGSLLLDRARTLDAAGRLDEAIGLYQRAAAASPGAPALRHALAEICVRARRYGEAELHARAAIGLGLDAPGTWFLLGFSLINLRRFEEAEAALRQAILRQPGLIQAHNELAQLVWMRTGDARAAAEAVDRTLAAHPGLVGLSLVKATILKAADDHPGAYAALKAALKRLPNEPSLHLAAAAATPNIKSALQHAERVLAMDPANLLALGIAASARLALGEPQAGLALAERMLKTGAAGHLQNALALQATAWRMLGDERAGWLYDYDALVKTFRLEPPPGWPALEGFLEDLTRELNELHVHRTHPFDQSLRSGSQVADLFDEDRPAIQALRGALQAPVDAYVAGLERRDDHPLLTRNTGRWRLDGAWSVRLKPQGLHVNHVHPAGWISSACYIAVPAAAKAEGRQGWLQLGEPGCRTRPLLAPERYIQPEPGLLVLFPSYMWHGTVPFSGLEPRLTVAFDVVPA